MLFVDDVVKMKAALALLASFATLALTRARHCPDDWVLYGNSCYAFLDDVVPWATAQVYCHILGARLLEVETKAENDFVAEQIRNRSGLTSVWQGVNDLVQEGRWVFSSSNKQLTFFNWKSNQPDNSRKYENGEDCVHIFADGTWNDLWCESFPSSVRPTPVCEKKAKKKTDAGKDCHDG